MIRPFYGLLGTGMMLVSGLVAAQNYQVGQYLGNLNEAGRFAYNTMGGAAQHAAHTSPATFAAHASGGVRMSAGAVATIGGRTVPLTFLGRIPPTAIVNAARGVALANPATAAVTLLGFAAMSGWLTSSGLSWNMDPATNKEKPFMIEQDASSYCVFDYWGNRTTYCGGNPNAAYSAFLTANPGSACMGGAVPARTVYVVANNMPTSMVLNFHEMGCDGSGPYYNNSGLGPLSVQRVATGTTTEPATWEQAQPRLEANSPAPNIVPELLSRGANFPMPTGQTFSGPASQPGQRTETQRADGKTEVKTTTHNYTYNNSSTGPSTITHNTTINTTIINEAGEVESEEEESTDNTEPETATDTPLPAVPDFYEQKYPDGLAGVWTDRKAEMQGTPLANLLTKFMPTGIGTGTCPQITLPLHVGFWDGGTHDISVDCNIWLFGKAVVIISALLLARRMIFGG